MKEYHFHTLQSLLGDIPAYAAILWVNFAGVLTQVNLPEWENWIWQHGWLILLSLRVINIAYDMYLKIQYEEVIQEKAPEKRFGFWQKLFNKLRKLIP
jgi:hypothetical protein